MKNRKILIMEKETNRISGKHKEKEKGIFKKKKGAKKLSKLKFLKKIRGYLIISKRNCK